MSSTRRHSLIYRIGLSLVFSLLIAFSSPALYLNPVQAHPVAATFDATWVWYNSENAQEASIEIDPDDGLHVVFSTLLASSGGTYPAYYGYCPADCLQASNWTYINLGDYGMFGKGLSLELTPGGQPRVLWGFYNLAGDTKFYYAECNGSCVEPSNWQVAYLTEAYAYTHTQTYFKADPQGGLHFVYDDWYNAPHNGTFYASCTSGCTAWENWTDALIDPATFSTLDLQFDPAGRPRIALVPTQKYSYDDTNLIYIECDAGCESSDNWVGVNVAPVSGTNRDDTAFALEMTSTGEPRLAMYVDHFLSYATCSSGCASSASNWTVSALGLPEEYGEYVDLELDSLDDPHLAYMVFQVTGDDGMTYATCSAGCDTASPTWTYALVETDDDLDASDPVPTPTGCQFTSWGEVGLHASFALDSSDLPHFVYEARNFAVCDGQVNMVIKGVRYASTTGSGGGHRIYLPLLRK